jgi:hypothetical protein
MSDVINHPAHYETALTDTAVQSSIMITRLEEVENASMPEEVTKG